MTTDPARGRGRRYLALALLLTGALGACGANGNDGLAATTTTVAAPSGPIPLLTAHAATILDQPIAYPQGTQAQVSSVIVQLPPGAETGWHRHDTPLYAYVLQGTVTVTYEGGVVNDYPAGTAFLEAVGTYHNGANNGDELVRILTVSMGAEGFENTVARP